MSVLLEALKRSEEERQAILQKNADVANGSKSAMDSYSVLNSMRMQVENLSSRLSVSGLFWRAAVIAPAASDLDL